MDYFNSGSSAGGITVDSNIITVDNDVILVSSAGFSNHGLRIIPRKYDNPTLIKIHDELKNIQHQVTPTSFVISDFLEINFDFEFRIKASYQIEIFSSQNLIYRSKAKAI
jgi:hypothetical protein